MVKLCFIADTHRRHRELVIPPCDILVHCGDICSFHEDDLGTLRDADAWFAELPAKHVLCVGGNHDFLLEQGQFRFSNAQLLEDRLVELCGLRIYGSPWCPDLPDFAYFMDGKSRAERWRRIPVGIDVLITHTPPLGVLDLPTTRNRNLGCPFLRDELMRIQPRVHVFGHVHASYGSASNQSTKSFNAAVVGGSDLVVRNPATHLELAPRRRWWQTLLGR